MKTNIENFQQMDSKKIYNHLLPTINRIYEKYKYHPRMYTNIKKI